MPDHAVKAPRPPSWILGGTTSKGREGMGKKRREGREGRQGHPN